MVGIAFFLTHLAESGMTCSEMRAQYPDYYIVKSKLGLSPDLDFERVVSEIIEKYNNYSCTTIDGIRVDMDKEWIHIRKSNTEPIVRIIAESSSVERSENLIDEFGQIVNSLDQ